MGCNYLSLSLIPASSTHPHIVMFCWGEVPAYFTHTHQGYFTGTGQSYACHNSSETNPEGYIYRIRYVHKWQTVYVLTRGLFWCLFPKMPSNEGNKHQNNTQWRHKHVMRVHMLFYFLHDIYWIHKCWFKNDDLHISSPCLTPLVYILLMTSQWPNNCDTITWKVISILFTAILMTDCVRRENTTV